MMHKIGLVDLEKHTMLYNIASTNSTVLYILLEHCSNIYLNILCIIVVLYVLIYIRTSPIGRF